MGEENVEGTWMTHTSLTLDQMGDAVNKGKKRKKKGSAKVHKFTIHGSGDEKEEVSVEVHQLGKTISVIIKMWDVGKIYGHCGNFDGNPDNEEDQEEWSKMIQDVDGPTVVAFAPIDWSVIAQPSLDGCDKRVARNVRKQRQNRRRSLRKSGCDAARHGTCLELWRRTMQLARYSRDEKLKIRSSVEHSATRIKSAKHIRLHSQPRHVPCMRLPLQPHLWHNKYFASAHCREVTRDPSAQCASSVPAPPGSRRRTASKTRTASRKRSSSRRRTASKRRTASRRRTWSKRRTASKRTTASKRRN